MPTLKLAGATREKSNASGPYFAQAYYDSSGKRKEVTGKTKRAAREKAEALIKVDNSGTGDDVRVKEFIERFLRDCEAGRDGEEPLGADTLRSYRHYLRNWVVPVLGDHMMSKVTTEHVRTLQSTLIKKANKRTTAINVFRITKTMFRWAAEIEVIDRVPGDKLKIKQDWAAQSEIKRAKIPSQEAMASIEKHAKLSYMSNEWNIARAYKRYYPLFLLLRTTGMRISECLGLQWKDFNEDFTRVEIRRKVSVPHEGMTVEERMGKVKSRNAERSLPVPKMVGPYLREWKGLCPPSKLGWVFCTKTGVPLNYSNVVTKFWQPLLRRADVSGVGLHGLRHYYASLLMLQGRYKELTALLGHHSAAFTMDQYGHVIDDDGSLYTAIAEDVAKGL